MTRIDYGFTVSSGVMICRGTAQAKAETEAHIMLAAPKDAHKNATRGYIAFTAQGGFPMH